MCARYIFIFKNDSLNNIIIITFARCVCRFICDARARAFTPLKKKSELHTNLNYNSLKKKTERKREKYFQGLFRDLYTFIYRENN